MNQKAQIIQFTDETQTLPNGSKIIYAENEDTIILHHLPPLQSPIQYVYNRQTETIKINGKPGTNKDKKSMVELGQYFLTHANEKELSCINVKPK